MTPAPKFALFVMTLSLILFAPAGCCREKQCDATSAPAQNIQESEPTMRAIEQFYANGLLHWRKEVIDGENGKPINHGRYERWHRTGLKAFEGRFVHGKLEGVSKRFHPNGELWIMRQHRTGKRHGASRTFDESGTLRTEEYHHEGQPHGVWRIWKSDGTLKWAQSFNYGQPVAGPKEVENFTPTPRPGITIETPTRDSNAD